MGIYDLYNITWLSMLLILWLLATPPDITTVLLEASPLLFSHIEFESKYSIPRCNRSHMCFVTLYSTLLLLLIEIMRIDSKIYNPRYLLWCRTFIRAMRYFSFTLHRMSGDRAESNPVLAVLPFLFFRLFQTRALPFHQNWSYSTWKYYNSSFII